MLNRVELIGRVGKEPEIRTSADGKKMASLNLATSEIFKDKNTNEKKEITEWHNLVAFEKIAEYIEKFIKKGFLIYVDGKLQTRKSEKDGKVYYNTNVKINTIRSLNNGKIDESAEPVSNNSDDIPF